MRRISLGLALSALSAVLTFVAVRPPGWWWLVFVALVPMIVAQQAVLPERWSGAAFAIGIGGYIAAYIQGLIDPTFAWWMRALPLVVVPVMWFLGHLDRRFHQRTRYRYFVLATPLAWVALDFLRSGAPMTGTRASLPYALFR